MSFFLKLCFLLVLSVVAVPQQLGSLTGEACPGVIQPSTEPGLYNTVYDTDPSFVYDPANCTSTDQQILPSSAWTYECFPAIEAACGSTSVRSGWPQSWTWGWHTTDGVTCQAGLYQDRNTTRQPNGGVSFLDRQCCLQNFAAMHLNRPITALQVDTNEPDASSPYNRQNWNRLSVNIAPGGFPHTVSSDRSGSLVNVNGVQAVPGQPSYILQAYAKISCLEK